MNKLQNQKGFTIIEVVLVLAIAGLIFLMVFVALPALQRNQADTARKNDASIVASAVTTYTGNNRGDFPEDDGDLQSYVENLSEFEPSDIDIRDNETLPSADDQIYVYQGKKCVAGDDVIGDGSSRQVAVVLKLEGGNGAHYCTEA